VEDLAPARGGARGLRRRGHRLERVARPRHATRPRGPRGRPAPAGAGLVLGVAAGLFLGERAAPFRLPHAPRVPPARGRLVLQYHDRRGARGTQVSPTPSYCVTSARLGL
jgi:hypothetical protein